MPIKEKTTIGDTLKHLRTSRNVSVKQICKDFQCAESTYRSYETNVSCPPATVLCKFADYYQVTVDYLLSYVPVTSEHGVEYYQQMIEKSLEQMQEYERTIRSCVEKIRVLTADK